MKKIITTVGISIFENLPDSSVSKLMLRLDKPYEQYQQYESIAQRLLKLAKERKVSNENASAEIKSIIKIVEEIQEDVEVHLLATDTILSVLACQVIKEWFGNSYKVNKKYNISVVFNPQHIISNLRIDQQANYEKGFMNLIEILNQICDKDTILNITAGYKAIVPIMTLYGQLKEIPLKYIFDEDADKDVGSLVTVGNLPFSFDWSLIDHYVSFLKEQYPITGKKRQEMQSLGLINASSPKLTIIGKLLSSFLEQDMPFQDTTFGYLIEYKLYHYYSENKYKQYDKLYLGHPISNDPDKDLEDADLWFENNNHIIIAEIKPATYKSQNMRKKIEKILSEVSLSYSIDRIKEFWVIFYGYEERGVDIGYVSQKCKPILEEISKVYPLTVFKTKYTSIDSNSVDGKTNRMKYQQFMRNKISRVDDVCSYQNGRKV